MKNQERYHGLDFVRAVAMMLGVVIHTCCFFRDDIQFGWVVGEYGGDSLNTFTVKFIHFFRMQLFMLLAGFFAELVCQRKGMTHLCRDRVKRIFVPFLVGIFLFTPFVGFLVESTWAGRFTNVYENASIFEKITSVLLWGAFTDKPIFNEISFWHFWFIYFLLFYYVFHWLFHQLGSRDFLFNDNVFLNRLTRFALTYKWGFIVLSCLAFPLHYSLQSPMFWPSHFNFQVNEIFYYFGFYVFGAYLCKNIQLLNQLAKNSWFYLIISLPFVFILNEPTTRYDLMRNVVVDITSWKIANVQLWEEGIFSYALPKSIIVILRCAVSWTLCLGFIGLAHRYLNNSSRYVRYLADSAYWVFWIHVLFTNIFSKYAQQLSGDNSMFKTVMVLNLCMFCMYYLYNKCIRYSFLGDYFMGKRKDPSHPDESHLSLIILLKKVAPICLVSLCIAFIWGHLNNSIHTGNKREVLVESFVARNQNCLEKYMLLSGVVDRYGRNPLHTASLFPESLRRYNPIPILLKKSVDINEQDLVGRTPLFYAVRTGNLKDAKLLIEKGADMTIADKYGHTPAHVAAIKTGSYDAKSSDLYFDILKSLREKGADMNARDYRGRTVLDCLKRFANRDLN
jgi:glucan biosynthesis protein C